MLVPVGIAYAEASGVPGINGLYATIVPLLAYALFGPSRGGYEEGQWGYDAIVANRNQEAIRWYREAVRYQQKVSSFWFNLDIAYQRSNDLEAASDA